MKIICKCNFDKESVSDVLICTNINKSHGEIAVGIFNIMFSRDDNAPYYYKLADDDYELYEFKP